MQLYTIYILYTNNYIVNNNFLVGVLEPTNTVPLVFIFFYFPKFLFKKNCVAILLKVCKTQKKASYEREWFHKISLLSSLISFSSSEVTSL